MTYLCHECGAEFETPTTWEERHGLECGPYEIWHGCPECLSTDYEEYYPEDYLDEEEDDD